MGAQGQKFHCESLLNSKIIQSGKMLPVWIQKSNQVCTNPVQSIAIIMNTRVYSSHHDDDHRLFPTGIHSLCSVHREKIRRHWWMDILFGGDEKEKFFINSNEQVIFYRKSYVQLTHYYNNPLLSKFLPQRISFDDIFQIENEKTTQKSIYFLLKAAKTVHIYKPICITYIWRGQ